MRPLRERLARQARGLRLRRIATAWLATASGLGLAFAALALLARWGGGITAGARWPAAGWWLAALGLLAWGALHAWHGGRAARRALLDMAQLVEREQLLRRGSLAGVVDLADGVPDGHSRSLAERESRSIASRLPEREEEWAPATTRSQLRRLRQAAAGFGVAAVVVVASVAIAGESAASLISPVAAFRAILAPRVSITVAKRVLRKGEPLDVAVRAEAVVGRPTLHIRATGEAWRELRLDLDASGVARHRLPDVRSNLYLFATAGGVSSDTLGIEVLEPPFISSLTLAARYPAYLEREDELLDPSAATHALPVGTVVTIEGAASSRIARAELAPGRPEQRAVRLAFRDHSFRGELVVRTGGRWRLAVTDRSGAAVEPAPEFELRAVPDSAPRVTVPVPGSDTTVPLDLRAAIVVDARDDHGLSRVELLSWRVSRLGVVGDTVVDSLPGAAGADRAVLSYELDLTDRRLLPGDTLRFYVRAVDRAPVPNVGRSREYALRLRSMTELREAVRSGADSLARSASALAADQGSLTRRSEDLAAQRNRGQDRPRPAQGRPDAREPQPPPPQGAVPFEQAAEAQRIADEQQRLLERAEQIRQDLERLSRAAEEAGLNDRQWQEQLRDLQNLLREAVTPELRERLEELRRALERLDPQAVQQALRRLNQEQQRLREELRRSAELFERAALEGALQAAEQGADQLAREQREWAQQAPARRDSAAAAAEEQRLRAEADSLARRLEQLRDRLASRSDSASAADVDSAAAQLERASEQMAGAEQAMRQGRREAAREAGQRAAESLREVPDALRQTRQQMAARWRMETLRLLDQALQETIALAAEQQRFAREVRRGEGGGPGEQRGRQSAAEQGIQQILRRLQQASGQHALVSPQLGRSLVQAREQVAASRQALEGQAPSVEESAERAGEAAQRLAQAAFSLLRNRDEVAGAQSGSGFAEAVERMARMAGQQGELNDELGGLIPMLGSGQDAVMAQLRALAERQRRLANELERLGESGIPGDPRQLAEEARQLADRIEAARLDRQTLERQQRLFRRMLDAGRSLRNEDEPDEPERRSDTGRDVARAALPGTAGPGTLRYPVPGWSVLRHLAPGERAMVLDYFRRLNERR